MEAPPVPTIVQRAIDRFAKSQTPETVKATKLALDGYGVYGLLCSRALTYLADLGVLGQQTTSFAASSMSSIVAFMLVIGYTPAEIQTKIDELGYESFMDESGPCCRSRKGRCLTGRGIDAILRQMMTEKSIDFDITLDALQKSTGKTLILSTIQLESCSNGDSLFFFSPKTSPDVPVRLAVRAALSVLGLFEPVQIGMFHYVDSHCRYSYPVEIFSNPAIADPVDGPAFGVYMTKNRNMADASAIKITPVSMKKSGKSLKKTAFIAQILSVMQEVSIAIPLTQSESSNTLYVSIENIMPFDFDIDESCKKVFAEALVRSVSNFVDGNGSFLPPARR